MKKSKNRYDIILIASLLSVALVGVGLLLILRREGGRVRVEIDGVAVAEYSLAIDGEYTLNGGTNILVIEGGAAYIKDADCPDKTCVRRGRISYVGQSAVCLPNRVSVKIIDGSRADVDIVS